MRGGRGLGGVVVRVTPWAFFKYKVIGCFADVAAVVAANMTGSCSQAFRKELAFTGDDFIDHAKVDPHVTHALSADRALVVALRNGDRNRGDDGDGVCKF